jgi:photosystem II stability/assembly factor-like uncharacterized protein
MKTRPTPRISVFAGPVFLLTLTAVLAAHTLPAANSQNLRWRFSNPEPHGNNIFKMGYSSSLGMAVSVAERGQFHYSLDLVNWELGESHTNKALRGVTFLNDRLIITGQEGLVMWGDSVENVQIGNITPTGNWLESVAANTNLAVAVGDLGAIYTSPDGMNWTVRSNPTTDWLRSVAWSGAEWVAVGESGRVVTSNGGIVWTAPVQVTTAHLNNVAFVNGAFYAVGAGGVSITSIDAATWTVETTPATEDLYFVTTAGALTRLYAGDSAIWYFNGTTWVSQIGGPAATSPPDWTYFTGLGFTDSFLLAGDTGMLVDGVRAGQTFNWEQTTPGPRLWLWDMVYTGNDYVSVGEFGTVMTSSDGVNWALELSPESATNTILLGVTGDTNLIVAVGENGYITFSTNSFSTVITTNQQGGNVTNQVSNLGLIWHEANSPTAQTLQGIASFNGVYYAVGNEGALIDSSDGTNWNLGDPLGSVTLSGLAASSDRLVAVGDNGAAFISLDGAMWFNANVPINGNWLYKIRYLNGNFIVVGENGTILTSTDNGNTWDTRTSGVANWLNDVTYIGDTYYVCGNQGTVLSSTNLATWTQLDMITGKSLYGVASNGGQMVVAGVEGITLRSNPLANTNPVQVVSFDLVDSTNEVQTLFLFGGATDQQFTLEKSSVLGPMANWQSPLEFELKDKSGTLIYFENLPTNSPPPVEYYRTRLVPEP